MSNSPKRILEHPYTNLSQGTWVRGNLHSHSTFSDGKRPAQEVITDYQKRGYDFLMLSDHDVYASTDDLQKWDAGDMVLIPGNEVTANGPHLLHVNPSRHIMPHPLRQQVLNEIALDEESFSIICHPNWMSEFNHASSAQLREWIGYAGIEIYNGVIGCMEGTSYATEKWDILLGNGRRVWGFANDDSHGAEHLELGWNMVYTREKSPAGIVNALREGRFYASTGVTIEQITVEGLKIKVKTADAERIVAYQDFGKRFHTVDAPEIEVEVPEAANYVRFECWGRGEKRAWTQPFFVKAT